MSKLSGRLTIAALLLAAVPYAVMLVRHMSPAAGGSDSSGYFNEARLMASGKSSRPIELLRILHLPPEWGQVFTPLGFDSAARDPRAMVPIYPPGLPAHFAIAAMIGGWSRTPFFIPIIAALMSLALIFILARQLGLSHWESATASAILAACPVFIMMAAQPMSDVVATMWTLAAIVCAMAAQRRPLFAVAAGAAFAISVCVRPSNLLLAIPLAFAFRWQRSRLLIAAAAAVPFGMALMAWNNALFGSPFQTGYGGMSEMLSWSYPRARFPHYAYWLAAQLTPLIFPAGLLVGFDRRIDGWLRAMLLTWFVVFFGFYCFYDAYDAWWYTRFLLPAIPPLIVGFLLLVRDLGRRRMLTNILVAVVLVVSIRQVRKLNPLSIGEEESIYPETVQWAEAQLPRESLVMTGLFSGALLYYSDRETVRYDRLDDDRFQQLRAYVGNANLHWYALLTSSEWDETRAKLTGSWTLLGEHRGMKLLRLDS